MYFRSAPVEILAVVTPVGKITQVNVWETPNMDAIVRIWCMELLKCVAFSNTILLFYKFVVANICILYVKTIQHAIIDNLFGLDLS